MGLPPLSPPRKSKAGLVEGRDRAILHSLPAPPPAPTQPQEKPPPRHLLLAPESIPLPPPPVHSSEQELPWQSVPRSCGGYDHLPPAPPPPAAPSTISRSASFRPDKQGLAVCSLFDGRERERWNSPRNDCEFMNQDRDRAYRQLAGSGAPIPPQPPLVPEGDAVEAVGRRRSPRLHFDKRPSTREKQRSRQRQSSWSKDKRRRRSRSIRRPWQSTRSKSRHSPRHQPTCELTPYSLEVTSSSRPTRKPPTPPRAASPLSEHELEIDGPSRNGRWRRIEEADNFGGTMQRQMTLKSNNKLQVQKEDEDKGHDDGDENGDVGEAHMSPSDLIEPDSDEPLY